MNVLKFNTYNEKELHVMKYGEPFKDGIYDFEVINASPYTSAKGNEMTKVVIKVFSNDVTNNRIIKIFDYIMADGPMAFKLKDFLNSIGEGESYFKGEIDLDNLEGKRGSARIGIAPGTGNYPDSNKVIEYMPLEVNIDQRIKFNQNQMNNPSKPPAHVTEPEFDDEVPF